MVPPWSTGRDHATPNSLDNHLCQEHRDVNHPAERVEAAAKDIYY